MNYLFTKSVIYYVQNETINLIFNRNKVKLGQFQEWGRNTMRLYTAMCNLIYLNEKGVRRETFQLFEDHSTLESWSAYGDLVRIHDIKQTNRKNLLIGILSFKNLCTKDSAT